MLNGDESFRTASECGEGIHQTTLEPMPLRWLGRGSTDRDTRRHFRQVASEAYGSLLEEPVELTPTMRPRPTIGWSGPRQLVRDLAGVIRPGPLIRVVEAVGKVDLAQNGMR